MPYASSPTWPNGRARTCLRRSSALTTSAGLSSPVLVFASTNDSALSRRRACSADRPSPPASTLWLAPPRGVTFQVSGSAGFARLHLLEVVGLRAARCRATCAAWRRRTAGTRKTPSCDSRRSSCRGRHAACVEREDHRSRGVPRVRLVVLGLADSKNRLRAAGADRQRHGRLVEAVLRQGRRRCPRRLDHAGGRQARQQALDAGCSRCALAPASRPSTRCPIRVSSIVVAPGSTRACPPCRDRTSASACRADRTAAC